MRSKLHTIAVLSIFISLIGCKASSYLESPNSLRNITGTLYLTNGKTVNGKLIINTDNILGTPIKVYAKGEKEAMKFGIYDVKGYEMRGSYYALKEIRQGINLGRNYSFMKRLTKEDSRIHLYENEERTSSNNPDNTARTTRYISEYYLQMPGDEGDAVYALSGNKFTPNFDEKMSALVADCPALAKKIKDREEGYFYRQISLYNEKRADVILNIIGEYNSCR